MMMASWMWGEMTSLLLYSLILCTRHRLQHQSWCLHLLSLQHNQHLMHMLILLLHHVAPLASDLSLALSGLVMHHSSQSIMMRHHNQHLLFHLNLHPLTRSPIRKSQMMNKQLRLRTMYGVQYWKQWASTLTLWRWRLMMCVSLLFCSPTGLCSL
jgi:hypothetical protein